MGLLIEGRLRRLWKGAKTLFFVLNMLISLIFVSTPVLLAIADSLVPSLLLSSSLSPSHGLSLQSLRSHLCNYDFRLSIVGSAAILCVYSLCDGLRLSRGPYPGITITLCLSSLGFVSWKACRLLARPGLINVDEMAVVACSLSFAVGHIAAAYRTSCRERRKLGIEEAVSACKKDGLPPLFRKAEEVRFSRDPSVPWKFP